MFALFLYLGVHFLLLEQRTMNVVSTTIPVVATTTHLQINDLRHERLQGQAINHSWCKSVLKCLFGG